MSLSPLQSGPRQFPRVKFVWGGADVIAARWRLGLFGFYERVNGFPDSGLAISGRGMLRWGCGLALAGYLAAAAALTWWLQRQPHNTLHFADVLAWPVRREHVRQERGRAWLAQGADALRARRFSEGVFLLRRGLAVVPDDSEARFLLAQTYLAFGDRTRAVTLLAEAPSYGLPSRQWRAAVFEVLAAGEDWSSALRLSEGFLARATGAEHWLDRQLLLVRKIAALRGLGQAAVALATAEAEGDGAILTLRAERILTLLELGRADEAAALVRKWLAKAPSTEQTALIRLEARAWREANRPEAMERALEEMRALRPGRPEPLAYAVEQRARAGRAAERALDEYIFRFGGTTVNLLRISADLAEVPDPALGRRVLAAARERGYAPGPFLVHLALGLIRLGDFAALPPVVAEAAAAPAPTKAAQETNQWLQVLTAALLSPDAGAQSQLVAFVSEHRLGLPGERATVAALRRAGRVATAREALERARKRYVECPWLQMQEAELAKEQVASVAASTAAAAPVEVPPAESPLLQEESFFRELDTRIAAQRWSAAQDWIQDLRTTRPVPPWLGGRDADLLRLELRVHQGAGDVPAMRLAARLLLNGQAGRADEVIEFATALAARGATAEAELLAKTVLEKYPQEAAAVELLKKLRKAKTDAAP